MTEGQLSGESAGQEDYEAPAIADLKGPDGSAITGAGITVILPGSITTTATGIA